GGLQAGRTTRLAARHRQAECGEAESAEQAAERDVTLRVGVPLRQHDDCAPRSRGRIFGGGVFRMACGLPLREEARARGVVLSRGRANGARPRQALAAELVVLYGWERVELFAATQRLARRARERIARVVAV